MKGVKIVKVNFPLYYWVMNSSSVTHKSNAKERHHKFTAELSYRNYLYCRQVDSPYLPLLLKQLYSEMQWWTSIRMNSSVYKQCYNYIRATSIDFFLCKEIPLKSRLSKIVRIGYRMIKYRVAQLPTLFSVLST